MTTTITISNDQQINGTISIVLPIPTIIFQVPINHQQNNQSHPVCVHCAQCNTVQTNDKKEEKIQIKEDVIEINEDVIEIKEKMNIKEDVFDIEENQFDVDYRMSEYILHKDPNLYTNVFSPISDSTPELLDMVVNNSSASDDEEENLDVAIEKYFNDISEYMRYLQEDIIL